MKQHYLPECYLKEFATNRLVFAIDIYPFRLRKKPVYYQLKDIAQVGRSKHFYTIKPSFVPNFKELDNRHEFELEHSFWYENKYSSVVSKIKSLQKAIILRDAHILAFAVFDFKLRNKFFRDNSIKVSQEETVKSVIEDYEEVTRKMDYTLFPNLNKQKALQILNDIKEKFKPDPDSFEATHVWSQIKRKDEGYKLHNTVINMLLTYEWKILINNNGFITNDNPGCSFDKEGRIQNTKYDSGVVVFMPLTPSMCLVVDYRKLDIKFSKNKAQKCISYENVNIEVADFINALHTANFNQHIFTKTEKLADKLCGLFNKNLQ